jgi:hypothetical protein
LVDHDSGDARRATFPAPSLVAPIEHPDDWPLLVLG